MDNECLIHDIPDTVLGEIFRHVRGPKHALLASNKRFREVARLGIVSATQAVHATPVDLTRLVTEFPDLHALTVNWNTHACVDVSPLGALRHLRTLNLEGNSITDITQISLSSRLESLNIAWTLVDDLTSLVRLGKTLMRLDISGQRTMMDLSHISRLEALTDLNMSANHALDNDASPLALLTALRKLNISHTEIIGLPHLPSLVTMVANERIPLTSLASTLTNLDLSHGDANSVPLAASVPVLQELTIRCCSRCDLSTFTTLHRLTVCTLCIDHDEALLLSMAASLATLSTLTLIRIHGHVHINVKMPSLRKLVLEGGAQMGGESLLQLPQLTALHMDMQSRLHPNIATLTSLCELRLCGLRSADLTALTALTWLHTLDMQRCVHTDLTQLSMLTALDIIVNP